MYGCRIVLHIKYCVELAGWPASNKFCVFFPVDSVYPVVHDVQMSTGPGLSSVT